MFERFNDHARRAVILAQEEARMLYHHRVDTEHLLLGLFAMKDTCGEALLVRFGLSRRFIHNAVIEITGLGTAQRLGHIPYTQRAKKTLELSSEEAALRGDGHVGDEHILLALLRQNEGLAALVLAAARAGRELRADSGIIGPGLPDLTIESARELLDTIRPVQAAE